MYGYLKIQGSLDRNRGNIFLESVLTVWNTRKNIFVFFSELLLLLILHRDNAGILISWWNLVSNIDMHMSTVN